MIRGLYTAASGMMVESARQETIANNLANSETKGFKRELALQRSFPEHELVRTGDRPGRPVIGSMGLGALVDSIHTFYDQGQLVQTNKPLDLAIEGDGFFVLQTPGGRRLTRSGQFSLDAERYIVNEKGFRVESGNGPLRLPEGEVYVDEAGTVWVDGRESSRLELVSFADNSALLRQGDGLFAETAGAQRVPLKGRVRQGYLENANVQVLEEMTRMLTALRTYEANQRMIQAQDEMLGKAVNEVGSLK